ncbi:DUF6069 family protein [Halosimplex amylolyticum]|uniref:DUF6069 family protein n=1 Tax=Halosimplex amylolyticum TaxID=3396616 RepID=UPI003F56CEC9
MSAERATGRDRQTLTPGELGKRGLVAVAVATAVNAGLTLATDLAGVAPGFDPLSVGPVVVFTAVGVTGAAITYALLDRLLADPDRAFVVVAAVVLVVSWVPDTTYAPTLPGATTAGVALLALLHLTAAVVAVAVLTDRYTPL